MRTGVVSRYGVVAIGSVLGAIALTSLSGLAGSTETESAQYLPITAQLRVGQQRINLEVPQTPDQYAKGLMFRPALPKDRGMYFRFDPPRPVSFWMRNTPQPLDMVFLYQDRVRQVLANVPPCRQATCPTYGPPLQPVSAVLELRAGQAAALGLKPGVAVQFEPLSDPKPASP
jgi:uncharacterized membrane protein (UPF0127 family)